MDGWIELAATLAPNAYEKLKKVLGEKDVDSTKVSVLISMMIYDQGERVLDAHATTDEKVDGLQESINDQGEAVQKVLQAVRRPRSR